MKILFYQDPPALDTTMLTWTLGQELILRGRTVHFAKPTNGMGDYDWVRGGGQSSHDAVRYARSIGARVHIHLEGASYYRIGADSATNWGLAKELTGDQISTFKQGYRKWMSAAYIADSCSVNGQSHIDTIQDYLFDCEPLPNCHRMSCGADARFALTMPHVEKGNYIVTASRIVPDRKIMHIAAAISLIPENKRPPWVIVGYGDPGFVKHLRTACNALGVDLTIRPCFGAEKWMVIKGAKLMVQGWNGIPPAEGLLCDVPVVCFDHEFMVELFTDFDDKNMESYDALHFALDNEPVSMKDAICQVMDEVWRGNTTNTTLIGKEMLLNGNLYACTQEQLAAQYEKIFLNGGRVDGI